MGMAIGKPMRTARGHRGKPAVAVASSIEDLPKSDIFAHQKRPKLTFLGLPAEVRNKIYRLVLIPDPDDENNGAVVSLAQPALTRVCKQIRGETLTFFYGENHFAIAMPFATSRDWYAPPVQRVTRSVSRRRAAYLELEQTEDDLVPEHHTATFRDPVGWGQFLYTLDVLIKGGPASAGGPLGPVRLVKSLTAIYTHPFSVGGRGRLYHFTVGFTGLAPGAGGAAVRAHMAPCRMADRRGRPTRFGGAGDGEQRLEADLARLLFACVGSDPVVDEYSTGADVEDWEWLRSFGNLSAGMSGLLALCPQLRDYVYLRVGEGTLDERYGEDIHELAVSEPVAAETWA